MYLPWENKVIKSVLAHTHNFSPVFLFFSPVLLRLCSTYNSSQVFPLLAEDFTFWVLFHLFSFSKLKSSELYYCNPFLYSKEELQDQTLFSCVSDSGHLGNDSQLCSVNAWCHLTCHHCRNV